jgi:hypothetical protein
LKLFKIYVLFEIKEKQKNRNRERKQEKETKRALNGLARSGYSEERRLRVAS